MLPLAVVLVVLLVIAIVIGIIQVSRRRPPPA